MRNAETTIHPGKIYLPHQEEDTKKPSADHTRWICINGIYLPVEFAKNKKE
jgi:hypothetical protein